MSGKGDKGSRQPRHQTEKQPAMTGTPEAIAAIMFPKMKAAETKGREAEYAAAKRVKDDWEKRYKKWKRG